MRSGTGGLSGQRGRGRRIVVLSEYGLTDVTRPGAGQLYHTPFAIPDYSGSELMLSDVAFGLPDDELARDAEAGKVMLGGCLVHGMGGDATHGCRSCSEQFVLFGDQLIPIDQWRSPVDARALASGALEVTLQSLDETPIILRIPSDSEAHNWFSGFLR